MDEELKRRFDGRHDKGTLTFVGIGASVRHQRILMFLEGQNKSSAGQTTMRQEYQLTDEQARSLISMLSQAVDDLSRRVN